MADNDENFHGYRFMMDAQNGRQYSLKFTHGKPQRPLHVHAENPAYARFKANENVYALDDDIAVEREPGKVFLSTTAWQFGIAADGQNLAASDEQRTKYAPVKYQLTFVVGKADDSAEPHVEVLYKMTQESKDLLEELGFDDAFPKEFNDLMSAQEAGLKVGENGKPVISIDFNSLPLPPHHPDRAYFARLETDDAPDTSMPNPWDNGNYGEENRPYVEKDKPVKDRTNTQERVRYQISDRELEQVLERYCKEVSTADQIVGREAETEQAIRVLGRAEQGSLCFVGEAGTGKTAMFSAVAQRINSGKNLPPSLQNARVMTVDFQSMLSGSKFRGQFEERIKPLIDGLQERKGYFRGQKIILAIDEIHNQLGAGGGSEGGQSVGQLMKPFLVAEGITTMGTTTMDEYSKHIEKDSALSRRFGPLTIEPTDTEGTKNAVMSKWARFQKHHELDDLRPEVLDYLVTMTTRYAPNEYQPGKAVKTLDDAASAAVMRGSRTVEMQDIVQSVSQLSKLPVEYLQQSSQERFLSLETKLPELVLGQDVAIQAISDGLIGAAAGLTDPKLPLGVFVLQGPTGTGKTETARALARELFGTEDALIRLDMAEYSEKLSISRLIGASPNYVGYEDGKPALTEEVRRKPYSILLLDEIEKAHKDIFNVLLPVFDDGKMKDNKGRTVLFNNVLILMTTNLGAKEAMSYLRGETGGIGIGAKSGKPDPEVQRAELSKIYEKAAKEFFPPEMINRINMNGGFATYAPLPEENVAQLARREFQALSDRLGSNAGANYKGVTLELSQEVEAEIAKLGYIPEMGARPLKGAVRKNIINPLARWLISHKEEILKAAAEEGGAKIVVNALGADFKPEIVTNAVAAPAATNDNAAAKKPAAPKKKSGGNFDI